MQLVQTPGSISRLRFCPPCPPWCVAVDRQPVSREVLTVALGIAADRVGACRVVIVGCAEDLGTAGLDEFLEIKSIQI